MTTKLQKYITEIEKEKNITVVFITEYGSKLYGTDNENSDTDYKGIFIPRTIDVLLKKDTDNINYSSGDDSAKNSSEDIDIQLFSIYKFFNLLEKGETGTMDLLFSFFSKSVVYENKSFTKLIKDNYKSLINKNVKAFLGYSVSMAKKYNIRGERYSELVDFENIFQSFVKECHLNHIDKTTLNSITLGSKWNELKKMILDNNYKYIKFVNKPGPRGSKIEEWEYIEVLGKFFTQTVTTNYLLNHLSESKEKYGNRVKSNIDNIDWKGVSHSMRVLFECQEFLKDGFITFPLKKKDIVKKIKEGNVELETVMNEMEYNFNKAESLFETSDIPLSSDKNKINELILLLLENNNT
jgi:hypothetical protein